MSILAKNVKAIRKELKCSQAVMAGIMKVGFRTYARYEAGERDAPAAVLIKMARLGNISLDRLLTTAIDAHDLLPLRTIEANYVPPQVGKVDFRKGRIVFKRPAAQGLIAIDAKEQKLLSLFRRMNPVAQERFVNAAEKTAKSGGRLAIREAYIPERQGRGRPPKAIADILKARAALKPVRPKGDGRTVRYRGKHNRKLLKERIDRLKLIAKSINKTTVE